MNLYEKINKVLVMKDQSKQTDRICNELAYAASLSTAKNHMYDDLVGKAADCLIMGSIEDGGVITAKKADEAEKILMPLSEAAKSYRVHLVAHAHIDMNWMWGYQETASDSIDTFRTMLDLMKEYPEFTFAQSQASTYEIVEKYAPEMLSEIKERVHEGRWEVSASTWVENDQNMPSGESMARHILYTKQYLSRILDISPDSLELNFQPDTFGHNSSVPEICRKGGVKYYYHCRGNKESEFAYIWKALSGADLLVWRDPFWYLGVVKTDMFEKIPQYCEKYGIDCFLRAYGVGDHGGGPTRRDIERLMEMKSWPIMPEIIFSTYSAFFRELEKYRSKLPVIEGERNYIFTGCYTSQSKIKMANRIGEDRMYESEFLSAASNVLSGSSKYNKQYSEAWKGILFNHFHDILPGSGVQETREYALGQFQRTMAAVDIGANSAMRSLASAIDTSDAVCAIDPESQSEGGGVGYAVDGSSFYGFPVTERGNGKKRVFHFFNPTQFDFDGVTELTVWDWKYDKSRAVLTDKDGNKCEMKVVEKNCSYWMHSFDKFAVRVKVPAFGYTTCYLDEEAPDNNKVGPTSINVDNDNDDDIVLENNLIRAVFKHATMELISLVDKCTSEEMISAPSAIFNLITENANHGMTSWKVGEYMKVSEINRTSNVFIRRVDTSGIRKTICFDMKFGNRSKLDIKVVLDDNSPTLSFECKCDFHELGDASEKEVPQLSFSVPFAYSAEKYLYDVPFGIVARPSINHDVPANSFASASNKDGKTCLMLVTDSKYGFRGTNNMLSVALIRGSYDPDPYPEYGVHYFRIGISLCKNDSHNELFRNASGFVHHCSVCSARPGTGTLPVSGSLFRVSGDVKVTSVKNPEDGEGLVIRVHNFTDKATDFTINFSKMPGEVYETDINEVIKSSVGTAKNEITLSAVPYEIKTILARF